MFKKYFMKFLILFSMMIITAYQSIYAQPDTLWTKTFGGIDYDIGRCVKQTDDGGFIITGQTNSFGTSLANVWLIKTDTSGDTIWTNTIGINKGLGGNGYTIQETSDEGYFIAGSVVGLYEDVLIIKTNAMGDTLWTKTFGGIANDVGYCGQQTSDGGYIITGFKYSNYYDLWLIKTDASGNEEWEKTFGGTEFVKDVGRYIQQTADGGYIITGYTYSYGVGSSDVWLIKTDASGNEEWLQTYGGTSGEEGYCVQQTTDGGYIITGYTYSFDIGGGDVWLIKTDETGDTTWTKTFGGNSRDIGRSIQQTLDGGYIITGITESYGAGWTDIWLIKADSLGNEMWTKTFGGSDNDEGNFVQQTSDQGYILTGFTKSFGSGEEDFWLICIAPDTGITSIVAQFSCDTTSGVLPLSVQFSDSSTGSITSWDWDFGDGNASTDQNPLHTYETADTFTVSLTVTGPSGSDTETKEKYIIVTNPSGISGKGEQLPASFVLSQNYPNPFNPSTQIEYDVKEHCKVNLVVYNLNGQAIKELVNSYQQAGKYFINLDMQNIPSGIYFYKIQMGDFKAVKKMIKIE
ncbi:T9SS type A sorting domain-containing protein [candidate division KSB1 bacterium]|nr:T9SS type A sorting domain-containing protein [candidate division KSB1 bacterium]